jgi:hypothetical protein
MGHVHYGMMMIAAAAAVGVGITAATLPDRGRARATEPTLCPTLCMNGG